MRADEIHDTLVRLALEAYARVPDDLGEEDRSAFFAREVRERMSQAAQAIVIEIGLAREAAPLVSVFPVRGIDELGFAERMEHERVHARCRHGERLSSCPECCG